MNTRRFDAEPECGPNRTLSSTLFRGTGLVFCAVLTVFFGLIPFVLGVVAQALSPRQIPPYVIGPLAVALFLVIWRSTGWLSTTIGEGVPVWPSVLVSLILFVAFFSTGAAVLRHLFPRRFSTAPTSITPQ